MVKDFLAMEAEAILESIIPYIPNLIFIFILFVAGYYINILINHSFRQIIRKVGRKYGIVVSRTTVKIVVNILIAILIISNIPGINESMLQLLGLIVAGIVAFSSSTIIANLMSGIIIKLGQVYRAGQIVKIGELFGEVAEVRFLYTVLETPQKELLTVPNALVMSGPVYNYTTPYFISVNLSIGYDVNRLKIEELLTKAAKACELKEIFVSIISLDDYAVTYKVSGEFKDAAETPLIESALRKAILDEFNLAGIEILSPIYKNVRQSKTKTIPKGLSKQRLKKSHKQALIKAKKIEQEMYKEAEQIRKAEARKIKKEETKAK